MKFLGKDRRIGIYIGEDKNLTYWINLWAGVKAINNTDEIIKIKTGDEESINMANGQLMTTFKEVVKNTILNAINANKQAVIVMPPTKNNKINQMKKICEKLAIENNVELLEIESSPYTLHSKNTLEDRIQVLKEAYSSWKFTDDEFANGISRINKDKITYIFIDDVFTAGLTLFFVFIFINEKLKNFNVSKNKDYSNKIWNLCCITLSKIDAREDEYFVK